MTSFAASPGQRPDFDFIGNDNAGAAALLRCRIGARYFSVELCRERFHEPGLVASLLRGRNPSAAAVVQRGGGP